jgi:hypothetical protein
MIKDCFWGLPITRAMNPWKPSLPKDLHDIRVPS